MYMQHMYTIILYICIIETKETNTMAKTVRLSEDEQERLRKKAVELNKKLMEKNKQPLRDSELVHAVLELCLEKIEVGVSGDLKIETD